MTKAHSAIERAFSSNKATRRGLLGMLAGAAVGAAANPTVASASSDYQIETTISPLGLQIRRVISAIYAAEVDLKAAKTELEETAVEHRLYRHVDRLNALRMRQPSPPQTYGDLIIRAELAMCEARWRTSSGNLQALKEMLARQDEALAHGEIEAAELIMAVLSFGGVRS